MKRRTVRPREKTSFLISLILHAAILLAIGGMAADPNASVPFGVRRLGGAVTIEIDEGKTAAPAPRASKPPVTDAGGVTVKKKPVEAVKPSSPESVSESAESSSGANETARLGHADGQSASGALGSASGRSADLRDRYLYELRVLLEGRKVYPRAARHLRETGRVVVRFRVQADGGIHDVQIAAPSSYSRLNEAAVALVSGVRRYKPLPSDLGADPLLVEVPIDYVLQ